MTITANGAATATVQTLTAEVRVLMVGNRQITLSVAKQLDRVHIWTHHPNVIIPFGRVKTGIKVECERKTGAAYLADPRLEVISRSGREEDRGALIIFEVGPRDAADMSWYLEGDEIDECRAIFDAWEQLPLIVLAGLR